MLGSDASKFLDEVRGLLVSAALDPLLEEPDTVLDMADYRDRAARGRFGTLVGLPTKLNKATTAAQEEGVLLVDELGVRLSDRARADVTRIRSFVERHYRSRFGQRG